VDGGFVAGFLVGIDCGFEGWVKEEGVGGGICSQVKYVGDFVFDGEVMDDLGVNVGEVSDCFGSADP